ncbi:MAG: nuclear transport factor 2 family protein [Holophaga sp.]|nr:nuclear transport factor 2 family protein [Holophaga sp.]
MSEEREIQQVLARYVRATDHRDGAAMAALFLPDGKVEIYHPQAGAMALVGELAGPEAIGAAVSTMMRPHPPRGWSHHTTHDPIIEIDGDTATLDAQFVVFNVVGAEKPADGWPEGARGAQGTILPIETGYYRPVLKKAGGRWWIACQRIYLDLPFAI